MVERRTIEEEVWAEFTRRVKKLEEALCHVTEQARRVEALERELSKIKSSLRRSEALAEGRAKRIVDLKVRLARAED